MTEFESVAAAVDVALDNAFYDYRREVGLDLGEVKEPHKFKECWDALANGKVVADSSWYRGTPRSLLQVFNAFGKTRLDCAQDAASFAKRSTAEFTL